MRYDFYKNAYELYTYFVLNKTEENLMRCMLYVPHVPEKAGPEKILIYVHVVLYRKALQTKFSSLHILLPHYLPIISKNINDFH